MSTVADRLLILRSHLPSDVQLVAVSKFHPVERLMEAYRAGQRIFAESRPQELSAKVPQMPFDVQWHFIGHLQTNKLKLVLPYVSLVQSVDSLHLLEAIGRWASENGRVVDVLLELHLGAEQTKQGFSEDEILALLIGAGTPSETSFASLRPLPQPSAAGPSLLSGRGWPEVCEHMPVPVLEVGPGMGVLTQYLLEREDIDLKLVEIDTESVEYLLTHFQGMQGRLMEADFLTLPLERIFPGDFCVIGNFPYNISSQIFFKVLDHKDHIPQVVGMVQKEVAERIAEKPGSKTYGILSVLLQAWYDIEYLFTVGSGCFAPPPKVESAVIRLRRNGRTDLGCDEKLFKTVVKTAFGQRRKMMRNPLKPLAAAKATREGWSAEELAAFLSQPVFSQRPEQLSVEDFVALTNLLA